MCRFINNKFKVHVNVEYSDWLIDVKVGGV